jgi:transcriptional regulator
MYRPAAFAVDDADLIRAVIAARVFATLAAAEGGAIRFAYAPVILSEKGVRYHLAMRNPLAALADGALVSLSMLAADAYVSPDWYKALVTVPTWNYIAVEGKGTVRRLAPDELHALVVDLSAMEEEKLAPKPPWTIDKVPEARTNALLGAIVGFELSFERLQGKFKLSQDKNPDDVAGVIAGLEARGDPASLAVARAMRNGAHDDE